MANGQPPVAEIMFPLAINTLEKTIFDGEAEQITVPSVDGQLTVLTHHLPLITLLTQGEILIKKSGQKEIFRTQIKKGFLEVNPQKTIVLIQK